MQIEIHKDESDRIVELFTFCSRRFPEVATELMQVVHEAKDGITLEIMPLIFKHTQKQRGYYWKWLKEFGNFCGTTPDETHDEILCHAFGTDYTETRFGIKRRPKQRSKDAHRIDYGVLIDTLIRIAA